MSLAIDHRLDFGVQTGEIGKEVCANNWKLLRKSTRKFQCCSTKAKRDDYVFKGGLSAKQQQVADAVPVMLAKKVSESVLKHLHQEIKIASV